MSENIEPFKEDFQARAHLAKLQLDNLNKPCQHLKFSSKASENEFTLIQIDEDMLKLIESGDSLEIRGEGSDSAFICTDSSTYDVKNASTSNTLLLFDCLKVIADSNSKEDVAPLVYKEAVAWKFNYYELKLVNARTSRIFDLLSLALYKGPQCESAISSKNKFTLGELQIMVQASNLEIIEKLTQFNCCCISGYWRMLDFNYMVECMGEIMQLIDSESWSCGQIPIEEACSKINDSGELVPNFIVKHLLQCYGSLYNGEDGRVFCKLDERQVCRFFAEMLLKAVGRFNYFEFLKVWKDSIPREMITNENYLSGLALVDQTSQQPAIFLFKADDLPLNLENRFDKLFEKREKWSLDEITPYIKDICLKNQSVSSLLTRYARSSTLDGTKVYSARKLTS